MTSKACNIHREIASNILQNSNDDFVNISVKGFSPTYE